MDWGTLAIHSGQICGVCFLAGFILYGFIVFSERPKEHISNKLLKISAKFTAISFVFVCLFLLLSGNREILPSLAFFMAYMLYMFIKRTIRKRKEKNENNDTNKE